MTRWLPEMKIDPEPAWAVLWNFHHNLESASEHRQLQAMLDLKSQSLCLIII